MNQPSTGATKRLQLPAEPLSIGIQYTSQRRKLQLVYTKQPKAYTRIASIGLTLLTGLVVGALLMMGVLSYGIPTLGGVVLASLIITAFWNVGKERA